MFHYKRACYLDLLLEVSPGKADVIYIIQQVPGMIKKLANYGEPVNGTKDQMCEIQIIINHMLEFVVV